MEDVAQFPWFTSLQERPRLPLKTIVLIKVDKDGVLALNVFKPVCKVLVAE